MVYNESMTTGKKPKATAPPKQESATELMKKVAERAYNPKTAKKVFSSEELQEILRRRQNNLPIETDEQLALRETYRKIKRQVKEMEKGNQSRVIFFPSLVNGADWYKAIEFSALYYAYRLADRMGRRCHVIKDTDRFSKASFSVSIFNIEKLVEQFNRLEEPKLDITEDGIYIFTLNRPLSDDEVGQLHMTEETRRERMHEVLRPKNMDPATFADIMMINRQLIPRVKKLQPPFFTSVGVRVVNGVYNLISLYNQFADGILSVDEVGVKLLLAIDDIIAGLTILAENRIWAYDVSAMVGENVNQVRKRILAEFPLEKKKR